MGNVGSQCCRPVRLPFHSLMCVFVGGSIRGRVGSRGGAVKEGLVYASQSEGVDSCRYKYCVCDLQICVKASQGFS